MRRPHGRMLPSRQSRPRNQPFFPINIDRNAHAKRRVCITCVSVLKGPRTTADRVNQPECAASDADAEHSYLYR
jgi:hypothetical protein